MLQNHPQMVGPNEAHDVHLIEHAKSPQKNQLMAQHILEHGKRMGITPKGGNKQSSQQRKPQSGDIRGPMQSVNPEIAREGIPSQAGEMSSAQNMGVGTGDNAQ